LNRINSSVVGLAIAGAAVVLIGYSSNPSTLGAPAGVEMPQPGPDVLAKPQQGHRIEYEGGYFLRSGDVTPLHPIHLALVNGHKVTVTRGTTLNGWRRFEYSSVSPAYPRSANFLLEPGTNLQTYCWLVIDDKLVDETPEGNVGPAQCMFPSNRDAFKGKPD
jgi:hypothetical protein